jgi:ParB-like nuclease family protein
VSTTIPDARRHVALEQIRVPENVRALDESHVQALAGSMSLQGIIVPVVVREDGDGFELVAGFQRIAAARSLGLAEVPVVVRDAVTEDADRAVENITSCRRRHDVIYADRVVIPMSELTCATVRREPAGEVGIRTGTDPGSRLRHTIWLKWRLPLDSESEHAIRTRRHARDSSGPGALRTGTRALASGRKRARGSATPSPRGYLGCRPDQRPASGERHVAD